MSNNGFVPPSAPPSSTGDPQPVPIPVLEPTSGTPSIPVGAWVALGISALVLVAGVLVGGSVLLGAFDRTQPAHADPVSASGECMTWPLCADSTSTPTPTPTEMNRYPAHVAAPTGDVPLTVATDYNGALSTALSPDWKLVSSASDDVDAYQNVGVVCTLTLDRGSIQDAYPGATDGQLADQLIAGSLKIYTDDTTITDVRLHKTAPVWLPVVGTKGRVQFATARIDYTTLDRGETMSAVIYTRVLGKTGERMFAVLECPTASPGVMPAAVVKETLGALQFQERD